MRIGSSTLNVTFVVATLSITVAGCHTISDPSCSILQEMHEDCCRDCLYCPNVCTDPLRNAHWYHCPSLWRAGCSSPGGQPAAPDLANASDVFALPE